MKGEVCISNQIGSIPPSPVDTLPPAVCSSSSFPFDFENGFEADLAVSVGAMSVDPIPPASASSASPAAAAAASVSTATVPAVQQRDWSQAKDVASGKTYWFHRNSGEVVYHEP